MGLFLLYKAAPRSKRRTMAFGFATPSEFAIKSEIPLTSGIRSKNNHAADRFALSHQRESLIDVAERHRMRDHRIDLDPPVHVPVDDPWHVGAAARAAKSRTPPCAASDQLERARGNFLTRAGDADDDALSPAAVTAFERRPHQTDVADTFKRVIGAADLIGAAFCHVHEVSNEFASDLGGIDEMRHAETLAPGLFFRIDINADDHCGADEAKALDDV